jgi:hypothetical protein
MMKLRYVSNNFLSVWRISAVMCICLASLFNGTAAAQTSAAVNVAGGTRTACAVAAADTGGVSDASTGGVLRHLTAMKVTPDMPQYSLIKGLSDPFPLQNLYSRLNPFFINNKFVMKKNDVILKQIAGRYIKVQSQAEFSDLIVDILTIPAVGKRGPARSQAFASLIATSLAQSGVRNVRLDHKPLTDTPPPLGRPVTKS